MEEKKPESLVGNLSSNRKYDPNLKKNFGPGHEGAVENIDLNKLKEKMESFKKKVLKKFKFTKVLAIIPQQMALMFEEDEGVPKEVSASKPMHMLMVIPEEQYKNIPKIKPEVINFLKETKENIWLHVKTAEVDLWNYGLDSKFEFYDALSSAFPVYDDGFLGALRMANIHKALVLNWLNVGRVHYVATYAIGGSLARGNPDKTSDVDTFVIIDDTDVKRMSRIELLEKLRGKIVNEFVREATTLAGTKNILNVQVYLLTDFWQSVKDAQPIMFTFIRDGIPLYDRGTFIPWKRLLQMGKIRPSPEAIDLYMKEGDRTNELVKRRLLDAMVDIYFGVVTPTQSMMMLAGQAPPVPKHIVAEVKKVLVDQEKVMSEKELKILEKAVKYYKDYEHGRLKEMKGSEIDSLMSDFTEFNKKMKILREKLEKKMQEDQAEKIHSEVSSLMKNVLNSESEKGVVKSFEEKLVKSGSVPPRLLSIAKESLGVKEKLKSKKISQGEMQKIAGNASELIDRLSEYSQRKELATLYNSSLIISYGDKKAEIVNSEDGLYILSGKDNVMKIDELGGKISDVSVKELESSLIKTKNRTRPKLSLKVIELLKGKFGDFVLE